MLRGWIESAYFRKIVRACQCAAWQKPNLIGSRLRQGACLMNWMSNGIFLFQPAPRQEDGIQTLKNRVTTAAETALLGARVLLFWSQGMFEIVHAVQKVTGNRYD